ncbi:hypothetical protein [Mesorhizobium sp. M0019]|uniref:hypothetical protein n=1 Tax=Mesorhizobium sp. M0019 TaxID=2956845 RepID=UPI0033388CB2
MALCEEAARNEGFREIALMATLSGEPLYLACGDIDLSSKWKTRAVAQVFLS